ncbi:MAG: hypothetical protein H7X79_03120, partial [Sporomusaceae bacterium]|nr:hypothetical protein [Sporomusaceae bacterium]
MLKKNISLFLAVGILLLSILPTYAEQWQPMPMITEQALSAGGYPGGEGCQYPISLEMDSVDGNFLLYGTDVGGIFKSYDGGGFWEPAMVGFSPRGCNDFAIDPNNINRVLAVGANSVKNSSHGIYLSTDKAMTWSSVLSQNKYGYRDTREQIAFDKSSYSPDLGYSTIAYWSYDGSDRADKNNYNSCTPAKQAECINAA